MLMTHALEDSSAEETAQQGAEMVEQMAAETNEIHLNQKFHIWKALVQQPNKASTSFSTGACHQCLDFFLKDIPTLNPFREAAETSGISTFDHLCDSKTPEPHNE